MTIVVNNGMFSYHIYCVCRNCLLNKLSLKSNKNNMRRKLCCVKARSQSTIFCLRLRFFYIFSVRFKAVCSHGAMSVDAISYVYVNWEAHRIQWNCTLQSHRMGVEPNHVWHRTHQCIVRTWNHTMWTLSLTSTQSIFCIAVTNKRIVPCERALISRNIWEQNTVPWLGGKF